ncbi:unnamed protein product [Rhizophagus irregularis]|nr:unnamed protein product [Rhizophagus irregularis]
MFIFISAPNDKSEKIKITCSPTDDIKELRDIISKEFGCKEYPPERQRLLFGGKQLENGHTLFHYNIKHNSVVLLIRKQKIETSSETESAVLSVDIPVKAEKKVNSQVSEHEISNHPIETKSTSVMDDLNNFEQEEYFCTLCENKKKKVCRQLHKKKKWGGGMACVGLSKKCEIVEPDYFGPIPGVPVGSLWKYRIFCSESGVHRPPVAGIAGKASIGSVSIVLSGGYPEDTDNGDEFYYTGSGGRDLKTGNKRVAVQSFDQELTKTNEALARTCDAEVNAKKGAEARNWKNSMPVRVCRSSKLMKHNPKYAPEEGIRYDGIYKLVKYWPERGASGFKVWRYLMRRDDPEPAPWTSEGKKRIKELGIKMIVGDDDEVSKKRTLDSDDDKGVKSKKAKKDNKYKISANLKKFIEDDKDNQRAWTTVLESKFENHTELIEIISEREFKCPVCFGLVVQPITTNCTHNVCLDCLTRSISIMGHKCPECRTEFPTNFRLKPNQKLIKALHEVIPTYDL